MHGYETKQQRDAHIKALARELDDLKQSIEIATEKLDEAPAGDRVERTRREVELERMKERVGLVQEQLRTFKGESPQKRASKRSESAGEKR